MKSPINQVEVEEWSFYKKKRNFPDLITFTEESLNVKFHFLCSGIAASPDLQAKYFC